MDKRDLGKEFEEGSGQDELKVNDRRLFDADGRLRQDLEGDTSEEEEAQEAEPETPERHEESEQPAAGPGFEHRPSEESSGVDFTMLIHAMAQPALIYLGMTAHPATGKPEINLEQARLQIDMLDVLRVKSRGNLTHEEEALLDKLLYELRMQFVARSDEAHSAAPE